MILDDLLRYGEAQPAAFGLSITHKGLENGVLNRRGNATAVIPDANLQVGSISGRGYDDLPGLRRNCLASIQHEVCDYPFETVGIEPSQSQASMMMLDGDAAELRSHMSHSNRALDCVNDV